MHRLVKLQEYTVTNINKVIIEVKDNKVSFLFENRPIIAYELPVPNNIAHCYYTIPNKEFLKFLKALITSNKKYEVSFSSYITTTGNGNPDTQRLHMLFSSGETKLTLIFIAKYSFNATNKGDDTYTYHYYIPDPYHLKYIKESYTKSENLQNIYVNKKKLFDFCNSVKTIITIKDTITYENYTNHIFLFNNGDKATVLWTDEATILWEHIPLIPNLDRTLMLDKKLVTFLIKNKDLGDLNFSYNENILKVTKQEQELCCEQQLPYKFTKYNINKTINLIDYKSKCENFYTFHVDKQELYKSIKNMKYLEVNLSFSGDNLKLKAEDTSPTFTLPIKKDKEFGNCNLKVKIKRITNFLRFIINNKVEEPFRIDFKSGTAVLYCGNAMVLMGLEPFIELE